LNPVTRNRLNQIVIASQRSDAPENMSYMEESIHESMSSSLLRLLPLLEVPNGSRTIVYPVFAVGRVKYNILARPVSRFTIILI